jgi:hypothetical protein
MKVDGKKLKTVVRGHLSRQKQNLRHRAINPARYCRDLVRVRLRARLVKNISTPPISVALISDLDAPSSEQQFYPFSAYRSELLDILQLVSVHLILKDVLRAPRLILSRFDIIVLKMSYRTTASEALSVVRTVRNAVGGKHIIYFDGDDDICVQWPEILPSVDLYVKKHVFRDRTKYLQKFIGKSNLHDYVHHKYNYSIKVRDYGNPWERRTMISESGPVPAEQLSKIYLGFDLALDRLIIDLYRQINSNPSTSAKDCDIVFRGSVTKETFIYFLRKDVEPALRRLEKSFRVIIPDRRVPREEYYREMVSSRICVSPFGYGEICWRDYEAVVCRCLLIKPNMSHVETNPDIFQPYQTYVPVEWDFSDLEEKCRYYLRNECERKRIVTEAYRVLDEFYRNGGFLKSISQMVTRLRAIPTN